MGAAASAPAAATTSAGAAASPEGLTLEFQVDVSIPVERVVEIAEEAGRAIMAVYNDPNGDFGAAVKSDSSPVTRADTDANAVICKALAELAPHVPIISEESTRQVPWAVRRGYQYCWCVDPLDGTKEFLKRDGKGAFTTNIALIDPSGAPVLGVVHAPATGETWFAAQGGGAFVRRRRRQGGGGGGGNGGGGGGGDTAAAAASTVTTQIRARPFDAAKPGNVVVASASHMSDATRDFISMLKDPAFQELGSSLKFLLVAEGKADVYPRLAPTCEWDTAAADAILREAGGASISAGAVTGDGRLLEDWRDALLLDKPLVYNKEDLLNPCFVAFGRRC